MTSEESDGKEPTTEQVQEKLELLRDFLLDEQNNKTESESRAVVIASGLWFFALVEQMIREDGREEFIKGIHDLAKQDVKQTQEEEDAKPGKAN